MMPKSIIFWFTFLAVLYGFRDVKCYKPVIFMHGLWGDGGKAKHLFQWINESHPGTKVYTVNMYTDANSILNLNAQAKNIGAWLSGLMKKHAEGIHLICFSQGGQVCRGIVERFEHNVHTFISLSSPLAGQFGMPDLIKKLFPNYRADEVYKIAYTQEGQKISVANYWNDPHHQDLYREQSEYLAFLNNDKVHNKSQEYKTNFTRLRRMVLVGGPDDGVIIPWQSSLFGFYDENLKVRNMTDTVWFQKDTFGLRTMYNRGALIACNIPGVNNTFWPSTKSVFDKCILPYLA